MWSMNASRPDRIGVVGVGLAACGAIAYGIATVIGRALAGSGVDSATALGIRFAVAAIILAALLRLRGAPMRPSRRMAAHRVARRIGYTLESTLFYMSLGHGTAAACILLFYAYPAIVTVIEFIRRREQLTAATTVGIGVVGHRHGRRGGDRPRRVDLRGGHRACARGRDGIRAVSRRRPRRPAGAPTHDHRLLGRGRCGGLIAIARCRRRHTGDSEWPSAADRRLRRGHRGGIRC